VKYRISSFVILVLIASTFQISAQAAVKLGDTCKILNEKKNAKGQSLICTKKGKKLVWSAPRVSSKKNPARPTEPVAVTPTTASEIPDPAITDSSTFAPISSCKLGILGNNSDLYTGFPRNQKYVAATGDRKAVVLFVDFADLPADLKAIPEWKNNQVPFAENAFDVMSFGQYRLKYELVEKYYRLPSKWRDFVKNEAGNLEGSTPALAMNHQKLISETVAVTNPDVDFSRFDFINIVTPGSTPKVEGGASGGGGFNVDGKSSFLAISGPIDEYLNDANKKNWLAHETGHILGLIHIYDFRQRQGAWDLMGNVFGNHDIYGWNKLFLSWVEDSQVACLPTNFTNESVHLITPIGSKDSGKKLVMVPISQSQILVVESRRSNSLDSIDANTEGILLYKVDVSVPDGRGTISILSNPGKTGRDRRGNEVLLGTLKVGDSAEHAGYVFKYIKRGTTGDFLSVKKS
jgi:M6 family metalloprotease-like protein